MLLVALDFGIHGIHDVFDVTIFAPNCTDIGSAEQRCQGQT